MINPRVNEILLVVAFFVKTDHESNILLLKVRNVIGRCQRAVSLGRNVTFKGWPGKGQDFVLDDPVQVTILRRKNERKGESP